MDEPRCPVTFHTSEDRFSFSQVVVLPRTLVLRGLVIPGQRLIPKPLFTFSLQRRRLTGGEPGVNI